MREALLIVRLRAQSMWNEGTKYLSWAGRGVRAAMSCMAIAAWLSTLTACTRSEVKREVFTESYRR